MTASALHRVVGAALLLAVLAGSAAADAPRVRVDETQAPWNAIGKLQVVAGSLRKTCTATLLDSKTVLTAAHCLYNVRLSANVPPTSLHFLIGLQGGAYVAHAGVASIAIGRGYDYTRPEQTRGSDWAILTLDTAVGTEDRVLPVDLESPAKGMAVMVGGYGQDNPNVLTADLACHVLGFLADGEGRPMIHHDCAATHGISGAPLLVKRGARWHIIGINVARSRADGTGLAVSIEQVSWRP